MEPTHGRSTLVTEIEKLSNLILRMSAHVETALGKALSALSARDGRLADSVIAGDEMIDDLQIRVEDLAARIIATEQPVATDLREVITAIKIASHLERIGDHARHLARAVKEIPPDVLTRSTGRIREMTAFGIAMVHDAITAFSEHSVEVARNVASRDEELDRIHREAYEEIIQAMREQPEHMEHLVGLMFLNRFLERLGDHVTSMCEWIVYAANGTHESLNGPKIGPGDIRQSLDQKAGAVYKEHP